MQISQGEALCLFGKILIISNKDHKAALELPETAATAMFAVPSKALPGFFHTLCANFLPALAEIFPKNLDKLPKPSA